MSYDNGHPRADRTKVATMKHPTCKRQSGISLFEALIALVVISVGVLAIAKLYGEMMASTGESKARAEAIQIAESRVDSLRNTISRDALDAALAALETPEGEPLTGVNADFDVGATTNQTLDADGQIEQLAVTLDVSWVDLRGEAQQVTVNSDVYWADPAHAINLARGKLPGGEPLPSPSGDARTHGDLIERDEADSIKVVEDFDRQLEQRTKDDRTQIVDVESGEVLLETNNPAGYSFISGFIVGDGLVDDAGSLEDTFTFRADTSDASQCTHTGYEHPEAGLIKDLVLYRCQVGARWYGNISIRDLDGDVTDVAGEVCVGDPNDVTGSEQWAPTENTRRDYRGVGIQEETFLGRGLPGFPLPEHVDLEVGWGFIPPGQEPDTEYGHHFVLQHFGTGNPSCEEVLTAAGNHLLATHGHHDMNDDDGAAVFAGNLGTLWIFGAD